MILNLKRLINDTNERRERKIMNTKETFKGAFMSFDTTKDNDIAVILNAGTMVTMKDKFTKEDKEVMNIDVEINGTKYIWSPWDKDGRALQETYGFESMNWIGKKLQILHVDKKMVVRPLAAEKIEETTI